MAKNRRSLDDVKLPPWKAVLFADIHFHARTIERGLQVLKAVREFASASGAMVIFLGDWWELRGSLPLRQLDPLLDEFAEWERCKIQTIIIPGNHDQVSVDGRIHGVRVFAPFRNFTVATERILWHERKMAFLPWREDPVEQAALFDLPGKDWTVFAHAEVEGATTNYVHKAVGRVGLTKIANVARACYLGHYHKRQQLGDRTWYIGSPFQHNFGERDDPPKGVAIVSEGNVEPVWIPLDGLPRHHRLTYGVPFDVGAIEEQDIVELYAPRELIGTDELAAMRLSVPALDVRPLPLKEEKTAEDVPAFALSLDQSIDAFVDEMSAQAKEAGVDLVDASLSLGDVRGFARAVLAELPEARAIHGMSPRVEPVSVEATDFCALRGTVSISLDRQGLILLKGPIGTGKTALAADALSWCLYGVTSPRKAGSAGSTFRGDEVIHDHAQECSVRVPLRLDDGREVMITRTKKRGKGAKISIVGVEAPDGISDAQDLVNHIVGLPYTLWRTIVSLGQGSVANFVTDADKSRKDLLSNAFGLNACPPAQKLVRGRLKPVRIQLEKAQLDLQTEERAMSVLAETDFAAQIAEWDQRREAAKQAAQEAGQQAGATIAECDKHLVGEPQWLTRKTEHETAIEKLTAQLGQGAFTSKMSDFEREYGAAEAEKKVLEAQLAKAGIEQGRLTKALEAGLLPCPTCNRPMKNDEAEVLVAAKGQEVARLQRGIRSHEERMANAQAKMQGIRSTEGAAKEGIEKEIAKSRDALVKIGTALSNFTRLRANREEAGRRLAESRTTWANHDQAVNPFQARQDEIEGKIAVCREKIAGFVAQIDALRIQKSMLDFWEIGFGPKGLPVLVLRTALHELELYANRFLAELLGGRVFCQLVMEGENLGVRFFEQKDGEVRERRYEQLSGGQRRCVELAFAPFALSEMVFNRCGVRVPLLIIDELTAHLGQEEKPLVCDLLRRLDRGTVLVIDHDGAVQSEFDQIYMLARSENGTKIGRMT
jgi:ABC-type uncharacterized transport system ATPase subunit